MDMWKSQYLDKWGYYDQVHSPKQYRSLSGFPVERNPIDYPYSYDEYVIYKAKDFDESKAFGMYSDRMPGYGREKYNAACQQVWGNQSQSFDSRTPEDIERFLCIYLDKTVKLTAIVKGCNASSGFPYWAFLYEEINDGEIQKLAML